jgi:hypothetical protein
MAAATKKRSKSAEAARDSRGYWERLDPVIDVEFDDGGFELVAYDDREVSGVVYAQFAKLSSRGRRVATFSMREAEDIDALLAVLSVLRDDLGWA